MVSITHSKQISKKRTTQFFIICIREEEIQAFSYDLDQHIPLHPDRYIF